MLTKVDVAKKSLKDYRELIGESRYHEILSLAENLKGKRIIHVNATAVGGGVAEILSSLTGLMQDIGLDANWFIIPPDDDFFNVTKKIHNTLQGKPESLSDEEMKIYADYNENLSKKIEDMKADIWVIHDPQPAASFHFSSKTSKAVWRCHIDTTNREESVWEFIKSFLDSYNRFIFSLDDFVPEDLDQSKVLVFPPAIDPLTVKNSFMDKKEALSVMEKAGLDISRPIVTQVSRFDPWKDPKGVIDAYRIAKKEIPGLQLALLGLIIATDDPEAFEIFDDVKAYAGDDPDIHLFADPTKIPVENDSFVKAFQTASKLILQKSTREGFGLVVTEALWAKNPVIGGNVGGIRLQIENGKNGFLVNSIEECADKLIYLLKNPDECEKMGIAARETVKEKFLLTRLLKDYLKLFNDLLQ